MGIPHPSAIEVLISLEVFCALYIPKRIIDMLIDREGRHLRKRLKKLRGERRLLIKLHVQEAHIGNWHTCYKCLALNPVVHLLL